jgi:putative PEP-CTERM system integral membrane protein
MKQWVHRLFHAIFWGWNLIFLMVAYLGILPLVGPALFFATANGQVPIEFSLSLVALIAVPTGATALGLWRFRSQPLQLFRLFYGVEAPLLVLCLLRLFLLRELTIASFQVLAGVGICILAFLADLLYGYAHKRRAIATLQLVAHSLMMGVGLYAGVLLLFYAVPLAVVLLQSFFSFEWVRFLGEMFSPEVFFTVFVWMSLSLILLALSGTLFLAMPSAMVALYLHSGQQIWRAFAAQYGRRLACLGTGATLMAALIVFEVAQYQPQPQALVLLQKPAQSETDHRQALLARSNEIRAGLVNAYLSNYRYLSSTQEINHIQVMYEQVFDLPPSVSKELQWAYNQLMSPFLYKGSSEEVDKAAQLYAQFFDVPIQKAEQVAINHALSSTFNQDEAKAGLLNLNQRQVWLRSQQVTVTEQGNWAEVELYEVYENQTPDQQEVFYAFSLPESAVITGLWLGDTDDRAQRFPFVVAPRGAAQQVYNEQVQRRVDPALLEQIGPRQYRLRAFPIPPRSGLGSDRNNPAQMHLWLTYQVMQQPQGWALPQLSEKRNLFWTSNTQRVRNGQDIQDQDVWLEPYLPVIQATKPSRHQATFTNGLQLTAQPLPEPAPALPQHHRFALVLDSSRSMADRKADLEQTLDWLRTQGFANGNVTDNEADLYLTTASGGTPQRYDSLQRFDPNRVTFYGTVQPQQMLQQFAQLRTQTPYDAILLLTDQGSYELSDETQAVPDIAAPLWMVHFGNFPAAYDDAILQAIQASDGGVATAIPEVFQRMATLGALGPDVVNVVDGYAWRMTQVLQAPSVETARPQSESNFEPLAARQLILGLSRRRDAEALVQLDTMHEIAKTNHIVTPYSSMLVLVNDQQREALRQAEGREDRFDREVETGHEDLTQPHNPLNTAVPEPSSAVAILIVGAIVMLYVRRGRWPLA